MNDFADRWGFETERFWLHDVHPERPVEYDEQYGRWNVYGYPEIFRILGDIETYTPDATRLFELDEESAKYVEGDMSQLTGPEHAHMRKHVGQAFTPKAMSDLEARIMVTADRLIDNLVGLDRFDLLTDFVEDLCAIVFSQLLGTPEEERDVLRVKDQAMDYDGQMSTTGPADGDEEYFAGLVAPLLPLREFLGKRIDECWDAPKDDLLGLMIRYRKLDGSRMSRDEIINFGISVLGAGRLSTPMLTGNTLVCLESFPEQAARVRADRSLVPPLLEETMRFMSPGNMSFRATNAESELAGVTIPKDQLVMLWFGAANRDPRQFPDPDRYDAGRNPNAHLGFGRGAYYCVGAQMVRIETRIMFNLLMDRFPNLRLDPEKSPVFFGSPEFTGVRSLPVVTR